MEPVPDAAHSDAPVEAGESTLAPEEEVTPLELLRAFDQDIASTRGAKLVNATERTRLAFLCYLFGALSSQALESQLSPPEVHALMFVFLKTDYEFDAKKGAELMQFCINATRSGHAWRPAVMAGADDYLEWLDTDEGFSAPRLEPLLRKVRKRGRP